MATQRPQAVAAVQIDNERVRVTEWSFAPGAETGWHRHEFDYLVVPGADGSLRIEGPGGATSVSRLTRAGSYFRTAGVEHNVINDSGAAFSFVEIELK